MASGEIVEPKKEENRERGQVRRSVSMDPQMQLSRKLAVKSRSKTVQDTANSDRVRTRVVLLNIIAEILQNYSIEETRFVKQPTTVFLAFFSSGYFKEKREGKQIKALQKETGDFDSDNDFDINCDGHIVKQH